MDDPFQGTAVKVISVGMSSPEKDREPETSMRTQQEQLQMWLVQEETCLQQHLAQVEQLFEEVLDVRLHPTSSSWEGSREVSKFEDVTAGDCGAWLCGRDRNGQTAEDAEEF